MTVISSRTPEGFPSRCTLCGAETNLEFSDPTGDAPCPVCGHLLWLSAELLSVFKQQFTKKTQIEADRITPDTTFAELEADSLDIVELILELESQIDFSIPDLGANRVQTIGDIIRQIEQQKRGQTGA